jgi:hypothetical protein
MQGPALTQPRRIPIRLDQLKSAPALRVVGLPELLGLTCAALLALMTVFAYFYFYLPAHSRLSSTERQRDQLQVELRNSERLSSDTKNTSEAVKQRIDSVKDFEDRWLAVSEPGRLSLYAELNNLIRNNGLRNTAGPSYTALEPVVFKAQAQAERAEKQGIAKWQSIYPGVLVSVTVEGPYQSVRHFVHDIEVSRQFVIINAVELEGVRESGATQELPTPLPGLRSPSGLPRAGAPRSGAIIQPPLPAPAGSRGSLVSLRLDMAVYFRRAEVKSAPDASK